MPQTGASCSGPQTKIDAGIYGFMMRPVPTKYDPRMVRSSKKPRRCVVDTDVFLWSVRHEHRFDDAASLVDRYHDCREVLALRRQGTRNSGLQILFAQGPGRLVSDGYLPSGAVGDTTSDSWLNLHEPGAVRALLDGAIARGWDPGDGVATEIDGWTLFDAVAQRRGDAARLSTGDRQSAG